jgi:hypothetical protein
VFICLIPPSYPITHCVYSTCTYSYREWEKGGGWGRSREKVRGATAHKAGSKIPT